MKKMLLFLGAVIAATAPALAETFSISNLDELREFMDAAHDSNFAGDTVLLTADIDCEGGLFNPGDPGYPPAFSGTFNGQGHTIRGICWTNGSFAATAALFGKVEGGAVIRDLMVVSGNVPGDQNTLCVAGLAASVGSDCLISNCHAVVDLQGVYPAGVDQNANPSCQFYGLARTVSGTDIRIVDCTAEGRLAGGTEACGFVGEAKLNGGEIARCAVFADVSTMTNRTGGLAAGFAGRIDLTGGATVRECLSAGLVDGWREASGFAERIDLRDGVSIVHDCYSTAEVICRGGQGAFGNAAGFAFQLRDANNGGGVTVSNCWFGGTARTTATGNSAYGFANSVEGDVALENCAWLAVDGVKASGTAGVAALETAASLKAASWPGYDFAGTWSLSEDETTPFFAWSLTNGNVRLFAVDESGKAISFPEAQDARAPVGSTVPVSADPGETGALFCGWTGGATYTNAATQTSALLADNHRTVRGLWAKPITTRAELAAIADDPSGTYGLGADIDLTGENWTPLCQDENAAFTGTLYGNGHTISNLTVDTAGGSYAGLFGRTGEGATITGLKLVNPNVKGGSHVGALAGYARGSTVTGITVENGVVEADGERAGLLVGSAYAASISRCSALGAVASASRFAGGLAGCAEGGSSFSQCYALGVVSSTGGDRVGGFIGWLDGSSASECFACGEVAASAQNGVGGFAGYVSGVSPVADCYALADVKGARYVGGFVGYALGSSVSFARCYTAGSTIGSQDTGSFAGYQASSPTFTDCFRPDDGLADLGAVDNAGVAALDAAAFLLADSFAALHDTGKWTQNDGKTQPYFAWSLVDGKMAISGRTVGTGGGSISGLGAYAPGTAVQIAAVPDGSAFLRWLGNAPYADATSQSTTVQLDNFRVVTAELGALIMNLQDLCAVTNALNGSFALGADIELAGETWKPIGTPSQPFTGTLHGQDHVISGLSLDNTTSADTDGSHAGLFGHVKDATFVGISLVDVDIKGYQCVGALAGEVEGLTTIRSCYAGGRVESTGTFAGMLVGCVSNANGAVVEHCEVDGEVVSNYGSTGGLVGGLRGSTVSFADCFVGVAVSGAGGDGKGGLVGSIEQGGSAFFNNCLVASNVTAPNSQYVGGFVGKAVMPIFCMDCATTGDVVGKGYAGGFAGQAGGEGSVFVNCVAYGAVTTAAANGSQAGGFIGSASGQRARFESCSARGDVATGGGGSAGGFVGESTAAGIVFEDCLVIGSTFASAVRSTGGAIGGFVGRSSASNEFARCLASPAVFGKGNVGGFVGSAEGGKSQYVDSEARGSVAGTGAHVGGFAGQTSASGNRFALCRALGLSSSTSSYVGGFVGYVANSNDLWRCMSVGAVKGAQYIGGFAGLFHSGSSTVGECFALGDVTALQNGDAFAGGFAGDLEAATFLSDSYCLGTVQGQQTVGGFAGRNDGEGTTLARCYAAGLVDCAGAYAGAFMGRLQGATAFADCAVRGDGIHAVGSSTAGAADENDAIAEYDESGFKDAGNFATWLATDDADGPVWTQTDGATQPYLSWSSPDGDLMVYASVAGSTVGQIDGAGIGYEPGAEATVTAISHSGFFVRWTGSTPYQDRTAPQTAIPMDNHRVAAALFGKLITTAEELDAVRGDLAGIYGLGSDIDLAGRDWTPIGDNSATFTGLFYGRGYAVKNLVCTNNPSSSYSKYRGLFGAASGATLDGIAVKNCDVAGYQYVGALVGRVYDGTSITGCSSSGKVFASSAYAGGLVGACDDGTIGVSDSDSTAETTGGSSVGGFIGRVSGGGASLISGCRADGFVSGNGAVGGFVGSISAPATISGCAARGDVNSAGANFGGFIGYLSHVSATNESCWASGAVWGTGDKCGSFVGNRSQGTIRANCAVSASANGARPFCGGDDALRGVELTDDEVSQMSAGWPRVAKRSSSGAMTRITTAEQLRAVAGNLSGAYVLEADIDLGGSAWTPIGNFSAGFAGEFHGNNHVISNYTVNAASTCAGLFGNIAGGCVEGVQAFGNVTGTSAYVGGFAGRICSRSLVKGCSFVGTVSSSSTQVGGFAGNLSDSPSLARCCAIGKVSKTSGAGNGYVGGFVGQQSNGGFIADSYARVAVTGGGAGYAGGFAGASSGSKIVRTYCSGAVTSTATNNYVGAFGGNLGANVVTDSYYDSGATAQLAQGQNGAAAVTYAGIAPVASADMTKQASFPSFGFQDTWMNADDTAMPYLLCFYMLANNSFAAWVRECSLPANSQPGDVVGGLQLAARYVFGIDDMDSVLNADNEPVFCVKFDANGAPYVQFAKNVNGTPEEVTLEVLASEDVTDWSHAEVVEVDLADGIYVPNVNPVPPKMFFRWRMHIAGYE